MQPQVEKVLYRHVCQGGPLDGREVISRFVDGFLLVDKPNDVVLIYKHDIYADTWIPDGTWQTLDRAKAWEAADGNSYDVIALGAGDET
jgi:hypothetical protein